MNNINFEYKSLVTITVVGYLMSVLIGVTGLFFPAASFFQLLCYQVNDALAIMASVIAARYTGLRGQHVAASAFILMGITHGVSMASSGLNSFNIERGVVIIMPMIPALCLLFWCTIFPLWLRLSALIPVTLFIYMYADVINGGVYYNTPLLSAYLSLMIIELLWAYYIYIDWKKTVIQQKN
jgi:hypothetical protein